MSVKPPAHAMDERFRALSQCAPIGIFMADADAQSI